ncbi:MAG: hypothetical protein Kow0022_18620 [Phycisphaerales bacterium]
MSVRTALVLFSLLAGVGSAEPPAQADLPKQALVRMRATEREELDLLLGVGFGGVSDVTPLSAPQPDIANFASRVVVLQPWSFNDPASQRSLQQVCDALDGLDDVLIIALHPREDRDRIDRMLERRPMPGLLVLDQNDRYIGPLGLNVRGSNLIVDRNAVIRYTGIQPSAVRDLVVELLNEEPDSSHVAKLPISEFVQRQARARELRSGVDQAWARQDYAEATHLLEQLWLVDPARATQMSRTLLTSHSTLESVVGLDQIARHASAAGLLDAIAALNPRLHRNEIAILVRALGSRKVQHPVAVLQPFLDARDPYVRQAALYALGDLGSPGDLALLLDQMRNAPISRDQFGQDDEDRITNALFGVAFKLTGFRGTDARDYAQWLAVYQNDAKHAEELARLSMADPQGRPRTVQFSSDTFYTCEGFDLAFRLQNADPPFDPRTARLFGSIITQTRDAAGPVLGVVYPAPFRVYIADDTGFAALAGNTYMGGQSEINKVILRHGPADRMAAVFAHEYVHILHQAVYENQPRWLSEGLADSISTPPSPWNVQRLSALGIAQPADEGVFTRLLTWAQGASSDAREAENYRLSHLAVDFLRFGPFPAGDTRLHLLMAAISQGRGERQALADYYADPATLDDQLRRWLRSP